MSSGCCGERPDLVHEPKDSRKVSPALSSRRSPVPSRRRETPRARVSTGASGERPELAALPAEELTWTTRAPAAVSGGGKTGGGRGPRGGGGGGGSGGSGGGGGGGGGGARDRAWIGGERFRRGGRR